MRVIEFFIATAAETRRLGGENDNGCGGDGFIDRQRRKWHFLPVVILSLARPKYCRSSHNATPRIPIRRPSDSRHDAPIYGGDSGIDRRLRSSCSSSSSSRGGGRRMACIQRSRFGNEILS